MPGIFGYFNNLIEKVSFKSLLNSINLLELCETKIYKSDSHNGITIGISSLQNISEFVFEEFKYAAFFSGDIIGYKKIPWQEILNIIEKENYKQFLNYEGNFTIAVLDKINKIIYIVSDLRAQYPLHYLVKEKYFVFSTALSTFCRIVSPPEFNQEWLYEVLYFNHPISETSFLKNVHRMLPASILKYDLNSYKLSIVEYGKLFERQDAQSKGMDAMCFGLRVFNERIPKYFRDDVKLAVGLTAGLDSRTVLSFAYNYTRKNLITFTYGTESCYDIKEASKVATQLNLPHIKITFDRVFFEELPRLLYETVYSSNGLEKITRASLLFVYKNLTNKGTRFPLIVTGVSGDHLFRDHIRGTGNVPAMISEDMMRVFSKGDIKIDLPLYNDAFKENFNKFNEHISKVLISLERKYGKLNNAESYMKYLIYETTKNHFAGEAAVANNFSLFRTPYWDSEIIKLAFSMEYGTLNLSESLPGKDYYRERIFQVFLLSKNPAFKKILLQDIPLEAYLSTNKSSLYFYRLINKGAKYLKNNITKTNSIGCENWSFWLKTTLYNEISELLNKNSSISNYLDSRFLENVRNIPNVHLISKVATAEIILRLIKNRWNL